MACVSALVFSLAVLAAILVFHLAGEKIGYLTDVARRADYAAAAAAALAFLLFLRC